MKPGHQIHTRDIRFCCDRPSCCCDCTDEQRAGAQHTMIRLMTDRAMRGERRVPPPLPAWAKSGYDGPTPPLDEFIKAYEQDDNVFWWMESGHHQNLLDAAIERLEDVNGGLQQLAALLRVEHQQYRPVHRDDADICLKCSEYPHDVIWPCGYIALADTIDKIRIGDLPA